MSNRSRRSQSRRFQISDDDDGIDIADDADDDDVGVEEVAAAVGNDAEEEATAYQNHIQNALDVLNPQESVKDQNDSSAEAEERNWFDSDPTLSSRKMINAADNPAINHLDTEAQARREDCLKKEDEIPGQSFSTDFVMANEQIRNDNAKIATKEATHLRHDTEQIKPPASKQKKKKNGRPRQPIEAVARQNSAIANAANVPTIAYTRGGSVEVNKAYSTAIHEVVDERMEYNNQTGAAVTAVQKHEFLVDQRMKYNLSWGKSNKIIFLNGKTLYQLVRKRPVVKAVHQKYPNHQFPKSLPKWWGKLMETVVKTKCFQTGKQTATSIPIGRVPSRFRNLNAGNAKLSEHNRLGLYMLFGDLTPRVLEILEACQKKEMTIAYDPTYGGYGDFDTEQAAELSLARTTESLGLLARQYDTSVPAILGVPTLPAFIAKYKDDFNQLEKDCRSHTGNSVDIMAFDVADRDEVNHYKRNKPNVIFFALANILVCYHDIINGLLDKKICIVVDKNNRSHFMAKIDNEMEIEYCIGSRIRRDINPNEFEDQLLSDGYYLIELFTVAEERNDFLLIDTNCRSNANYTSETNNDLYRAIPYPDSMAIPYPDTISRTVRLGMISQTVTKAMTGWTCNIRKSDGVGSKDNKQCIQIHRLVNVVANHNGFGFNNYTPLREYLQLHERETITSNKRFQYHDFTNERSAHLIECRSNELQHKEWVNVKLASICDIDHMIGRSKLWMNSNFFTWMVSHQYNSQLACVRMFFGDWLYGFSGEIEYRSGNDVQQGPDS